MSVEGNVNEIESLKALRGKITTIPQVDNTLTKKGYSADAKVTGDAINERIKYRDIADNMITDDPEKVASARQVFLIGKQLASINLSEASTVGYDNDNSGLNAQNMQGAIDELALGVKNSVSKAGNNLIDGTLSVRNADNGYGTFSKNNSAKEDYGTQMMDHAIDGRIAKVSVCGALDSFTYTGNDGQVRDVHHEGNKPFGSYIGDGIANERNINTKGIGRLILVYNHNYFSFVTPEGALVAKLSTGSISWIEGAKAYFLNGKLGLHTNNSAFNEVDEVYYYQVI